MSTAASPDATRRSCVLEFDRVNFAGGGETSIRMNQFSATISQGELVRIVLDRHHNSTELSSSILGLVGVDSGTIQFCGQDWLGSDFSRHFTMRSQIGRVFSGAAWVQSLTVRDNLCLAMLHHGVDPEAAESKMNRWGERVFGCALDSIRKSLNQRPHSVEPSMLQLCQLVRAVCNDPRLLILERPTTYIPETRLPDIAAVVRELQDTGTAVLLFAERGSHQELSLGETASRWHVANDVLAISGDSRP